MTCSRLGVIRFPNSSLRPPPAMAMTVSRSVTAQIQPVLLFSVSHSCPANSSTLPIREYFLKITSPSLLV